LIVRRDDNGREAQFQGGSSVRVWVEVELRQIVRETGVYTLCVEVDPSCFQDGTQVEVIKEAVSEYLSQNKGSFSKDVTWALSSVPTYEMKLLRLHPDKDGQPDRTRDI
jgi:hypothetical protein